jgi:hypothetical protein
VTSPSAPIREKFDDIRRNEKSAWHIDLIYKKEFNLFIDSDI